MPGRRGRSGGKRTGTVGKAYGNRSDLNGGPQPAQAATGQGYGQAKAQMDAQRAVPVGTPSVPPPQFSGPPEGMAKAGSMGDLFAASANPDEHVMSGASLGPGPGPEVFGADDTAQTQAGLDWARQYLPEMEFAANRANSDPARQIVRLLKSRISLGPN
jgi:hypothetical protein